MRPRFHLPDIDPDGQGVLVGDEAGHLTRVLRLGVGAGIDVFDGRGRMFHAHVVEVARDGVRVAIDEPAPAAPEPRVRVTVALSVLRADRMDQAVRDAVMMGVEAIEPVVAARSETSLASLARGHRVDRWQRIAVASVKQCGRATVPPVHPPVPLPAWMASTRGPVLVLAEPGAGPGAPLRDIPRADAVRMMVGPEGGWTPDETAAFVAAGLRLVALGGRTIRADAVPLVALAALYEAWDGW